MVGMGSAVARPPGGTCLWDGVREKGVAKNGPRLVVLMPGDSRTGREVVSSLGVASKSYVG